MNRPDTSPGTLERAIAIAVEAHAGQADKVGAPYVLHPLRLASRLRRDSERIAALLHDVVEDCPDWPLERLAGEGFSPAVLEAVDRLTKRPGEDYDAFVARAAANPIARAVKLADLEDNLDVTRLPEVTEQDRERLNRYLRARRYLLAAMDGEGGR